MRLIYISGDLQNFLFFNEIQSTFEVYSYYKRAFQFLKERPIITPLVDNNLNYFNQVSLDDFGHILQFKLRNEEGKKCFQIYNDGQKMRSVNRKFSFIQEYLRDKNDQGDFGFVIIKDYLLVKKTNQIQYMKIVN